ncbi:Probable protein phosphatase 2C 74 [Linum perenne]
MQLEKAGRDPACSMGVDCFFSIARAFGTSCFTDEGSRGGLRQSSGNNAEAAKRKKKRQMMMKRSDSKMEALLHRIPGRLFLNSSSDCASLFTKPGKKGVNQDSMIVWENFGPKEDTVFCGVFDGHGPSGHLVSKKVRDSLPLKLRAHWEVDCSNSELGSLSSNTLGRTALAEFSLNPKPVENLDHGKKKMPTDNFLAFKDSFLKAFKAMDKELQLHPYIDCYCSGSTAVTVIKQGRDLIIGNVGDSRAVLGKRDKGNNLIALQLTEDLKPSLPREAERIKLSKGRVFALPNEPDIYRIWLPHNNSPGLAMTRAFGDFCLKDYGLISVPEVSYYRISDKDEFIVLASDGVWDVLSNDEVVSIVGSVSPSSAAQTLVEFAHHAWRTKYPTSKTDDCAAACLFLGSSNISSAEKVST